MMKPYDRLLNGPIVFPTEQRSVGSGAVRTSIYRAMHDQKQESEMTKLRAGEGGKPASIRGDAKGFGVFVDSRFTY